MSSTNVWVVGVGTPHGDDRVGWEAAARLRERLTERAKVDAVSDPLALLDGPPCRVWIVIDASRGAGIPGSMHRFEWPDSRFMSGDGVSSHGVGLATALQLADAINRLPPRVVVFAIEGESGEPGAGLSASVAAALPELVDRVVAEANGDSSERGV